MTAIERAKELLFKIDKAPWVDDGDWVSTQAGLPVANFNFYCAAKENKDFIVAAPELLRELIADLIEAQTCIMDAYKEDPEGCENRPINAYITKHAVVMTDKTNYGLDKLKIQDPPQRL